MPDHEPANLAQSLDGLKPKGKSPTSARILHTWIAQAQDRLGSAGPRLGWLVAATVVTAALQRAVDASGTALFLLKGGTMLQYRLPGMSRTTQDVDGLVRGDIDRFMAELDATLSEPWGSLTLVRGEVEIIDTPHKLVKPRRFDMTVLLNGVTWRRVQVEVSPDEGDAGSTPEQIPSPSLAGFGCRPQTTSSACRCVIRSPKKSMPSRTRTTAAFVNDRARDVVDLLLLRTLTETTAHPSSTRRPSRCVNVRAIRTAAAVCSGQYPRLAGLLPDRRFVRYTCILVSKVRSLPAVQSDSIGTVATFPAP